MDAINRLLAAAYNPVDASQRALDIGTRAADFVASANALLGELESEANALRASGAIESDPRVVMLAKDFAYIDGIVNATAKAVNATWTRLHSRN
jgi:hypothetical protein